MSTGTPDRWVRPYRAARSSGVEAALSDLYDRLAPGSLVAGPSGQAMAPGAVERAAVRVWPTGTPLRGLVGVTAVPLPAPVRDADLVAVRGLPRPDGQGPGPYQTWLLGLAWLRLGTSVRLLDQARSHLASRSSAGESLLRNPLLQAALAEAVTEQLTVRASLTDLDPVGESATRLVQAHHQLTDSDDALLPVLGAAGYTQDGPGRAAYLSRLLADVYLPARHDMWMPA